MKRWDTVCSVCASGFSVACMSSMAAASAAVGAGAMGVAVMRSAGSMEDPGSAFLTRIFDSIGLGVLNRMPNGIAQPLLLALLTMSIVLAYVAYRGHRTLHALILSLASALIMYPSIYVWMSEMLYFISLAGMITAAALGVVLARRREKTICR